MNAFEAGSLTIDHAHDGGDTIEVEREPPLLHTTGRNQAIPTDVESRERVPSAGAVDGAAERWASCERSPKKGGVLLDLSQEPLIVFSTVVV